MALKVWVSPAQARTAIFWEPFLQEEPFGPSEAAIFLEESTSSFANLSSVCQPSLQELGKAANRRKRCQRHQAEARFAQSR